MSLLDELRSLTISKFPGWQSRLDEEDSSQVGALLSLNCEYLEGQVIIPRTGFGPVIVYTVEWDANQTIQHIFNWRPYTASWLIRFHSLTTIIARNLLDISGGLDMWTLITDLDDWAVFGIACAEEGSRLYIAFFTTAGFGARKGIVWDGSDTNGVPNVESLFQGPFLSTELTITSEIALLIPGDGEVPLTAGTHNVVFIFTSKNAQDAGLSPVSEDSVLVPFELEADGESGYNVIVTPTSAWPNWCRTCQICMTTTSNPSRYFLMANIPAANVPTPGASTPLTFRVWGTDQDLATFTEVTDLPNQLMQEPGGAGGSGPFNPVYIDSGGNNRMAYAAQITDLYLNILSVIYVSDPNAPQSITADQHAIRLPGQRRVTTIRWLAKSLFIFGPTYTYASLDNGDLPVLWPPPELVDGSIGSPFPHGVSANASRGYLWVGDQAGLQLLRGGSYSVKPISHFQGASDWKRINWAAPANSFQVYEDSTALKVMVRAALRDVDSSGNIDPDSLPQYSTHIMVWDYSQLGSGIEGVNYKNVFYSRFNLKDAEEAAYKPGHLARVQHPQTKREETWVSRVETAGKVMRKKYPPVDAISDLYNDDVDAGIDGQYRTIPISTLNEISTWEAASVRATGAGDLTVQANTLDSAVEQPLNSIPLSAAPGRTYLRWFPIAINTPSLSFLFTNGAVANSYAIVSLVKGYFKRFVTHLLG